MTGYRLDQYGGLAEVVEIKIGKTGEPIIPAGIFTAPAVPEAMTLAEGQVLVLEDNQWVVKESHIGEQYWLPDDEYGAEAHKMETYGPLPEGATTTPPAQPTETERFIKEISSKTAEELRSFLYSSQRYRFVDDDITKGKSDVPMCQLEGVVMTVDEASQQWLRYVGDNESKAAEALEEKIAGKTYIRTVVAAYKGEEE